MSYYNTTNETGQDLKTKHLKADRLQDKVLRAYKTLNQPLSPSMVWRYLGPDEQPITSVRRAITDLTTDGKLQKTDKRVTGLYGSREYCWRLS